MGDKRVPCGVNRPWTNGSWLAANDVSSRYTRRNEREFKKINIYPEDCLGPCGKIHRYISAVLSHSIWRWEILLLAGRGGKEFAWPSPSRPVTTEQMEASEYFQRTGGFLLVPVCDG